MNRDGAGDETSPKESGPPAEQLEEDQLSEDDLAAVSGGAGAVVKTTEGGKTTEGVKKTMQTQ